MGQFFAVSAIRDSCVDGVAEAVVQYAIQHNVEVGVSDPPADEAKPSRDALIFAPVNGWSVIVWPEYFNIHDFAACQALSQNLKTIVCAAHVYDGDYWAHGLFDSGEFVNRFCS